MAISCKWVASSCMSLHGEAFLTEEGGVFRQRHYPLIPNHFVCQSADSGTTGRKIYNQINAERQVNGRMTCPRQMLREFISGMVSGRVSLRSTLSKFFSPRIVSPSPDHHRG